jgi:isoquinoline 1-oxidoreductase
VNDQFLLEDEDQIIEPVGYDFGLSRRSMLQILGAGVVIAASASGLVAQNRGGGGRGNREQRPVNLDARLHIGKDGIVTVMTGKVECGQGARSQLTQVAAEELRLSPDNVRMIMADTSLCPDDGGTSGSRTTPSTVPAVRRACAAARALLIGLAAKTWNIPTDSLTVADGAVNDSSQNRKLTYADLAGADVLKQTVPADVQLTPVEKWKVMGTVVPRPDQRDLVTGAHKYPSDIIRPGMLYGKVLRAPSYGARLTSVDLAPAKAMDGVVAVHDGAFVGVAAPNTDRAKRALRALEQNAQWESAPHPASSELFKYLRDKADGGVPGNPFAEAVKSAAKTLKATFECAYIQHVPMEPRAAVAEWENGSLTVWTATQNPFNVRQELARAFSVPPERVRVIIPDFGGGFGGKHTGETAVEAARLAQAAGKPVALRWTRAEEMNWAVFRPAALIEAEASLDASGSLNSWYFINVNSGGSAVDTPYKVAQNRSAFIRSDAPLRHGSYRALASTVNCFARECLMDELAEAAGKHPLEFRLNHLENPRLRAVLEEAAKKFDFAARRAQKSDGQVGVGIACGTEKGSFVATCAEVAVDKQQGTIAVRNLTQAYECGAIINPDNLLAQVQGCMVMALGPALREAMEFDEGVIRNASLWKYQVPRFKDMPKLDIHLVNRPDLPSVGAGETPIIAVAPAIANAVHHATGQRLRTMPMRVS